MILVLQPLILTVHNLDGNGDADFFAPRRMNEARQAAGGEL